MSRSFRGAVGAVLLVALPSMASAAPPVESELTAPGPLAELRSVNGQVEYLLRDALARRGIKLEAPTPARRGRPPRQEE